MKRRVLTLSFLLLALLCAPARAEEANAQNAAVEAAGFSAPRALCDGDRDSRAAAGAEASVRVSRADGVHALYILFDRPPAPWTAEDEAGRRVSLGEDGMLHVCLDVEALLGGAPQTLTLRFAEGTQIAEIYAFSAGELPEWVQVWQPPCETADLLLVSTHSDDEQLFFAGVLPYYARERALDVQVVYLVQHYAGATADRRRSHELLDGLWAAGVRHYPVISEFPDLYAQSKDRAAALARITAAFAAEGYDYDDFAAYLTANLRRFRPLVVVSHDPNGEYGHAAHVLCCAALRDALDAAPDAARYPESAEAYGTWEVEKTYLHLYPENRIVMDWDTPLESFGGKTAFEATQEAFRFHKSQHWTWFYKWIYGTAERPIRKASEIGSYSPCLYGLYASKVGPDEAGGDFMEHVETYAQRRAREEAERAAAEEAARQAEEQARREAEAAEAAEAEEAARQAAEEAQRQAAAERAAQETVRKAQERACVIFAAAGAAAGLWHARARRNKR